MIRSPAGYGGEIRIKRYQDYYQASYGVMMLSAGQAFTPLELFASGAPGVWYDPSDLSTMFQDSAGTTPVTGVEQPVGLRLDKSRNGVGTNGAKRVNLLSWTEAFDNAVWSKVNASVVANTTETLDPVGTYTSEKYNDTAVSGFHAIEQSLTTNQSSTNYSLSVYIKSNGATTAYLKSYFNASPYDDFTATFNLSNATVTTAATGAAVVADASIVSVGNGWYRCSISGRTGKSSSNWFQFGIGTGSYTGNASNGLYIWGADLRLASEASTLPIYQPITATWRDTIPGSHAYQTTDINRPVLSCRYNQLLYTEQFDNGWTTTEGTISANAATAPDGAATADKIVEAVGAISFGPRTAQSASFASGATYTFSVCVKPAGRDWVRIELPATAFTAITYAWFNVATGASGTTANSPTTAITSVGNGWYRISVSKAATSTTSGFPTVRFASSDLGAVVSYTGDGTSGIYIWGADLRVSNDGVGLPPYQRVTGGTEGSGSGGPGTITYDTTGFPLYLRYNGTNSTMQTAAIDFSSTAAMSVFAGVRKLSDAAQGVLAELSTAVGANNGSFVIFAPTGAFNDYDYRVKGSTAAAPNIVTPYVAPITNVVTGLSAIATDTSIVRINGVQVGTVSLDQGTGNFGNYPLYLGARGGSSLWFNGRDYGLIVLGRTPTAAEIANTEAWLNGKTKAYA